ncbi:Fe-S cluster assembly ATPase SufC [SAR202 cluster bacterium AC-409-J13_OGT_754m]|nr:Fe-S cluster assembly ATPase SufC [SAR202 cluster bacterium AC-409-J13_OGT_754m]
MLEIKNLNVSTDNTHILKGISLKVSAGEIHAIMGPNGSGKSSLAFSLAGKPGYNVTSGEIIFDKTNITSMEPEGRARAGIFLSFQHPVEVPGVRLDQFLRASFNAINKSREMDQLDPLQFDKKLKERLKVVDMDPALTKRFVNTGFSGGEKKRNEILQMAILQPQLAVLDEPDSGLDVDALKSVADAINKLRHSSNAIIIITHYQRILEYVVPDAVHILMDGRIVKSGNKDLAREVESQGYEQFANYLSNQSHLTEKESRQ